MYEDALTLLLSGTTVNWYLGNRDIRLTFAVFMRVEVIDTSPGTDAQCLCRFIHLMMCYDDVVERAGVEPACRLFLAFYYPTPFQKGRHSPIANLPCKKPDYLHRPSGVNDIILIGVWTVQESNPPLCVSAPQQCFSHLNLPSKLAEITRPAVGV